ncbi:MAG: 16S rRNA (guanine(527)-N(7))-methyltransferase RsmG [Rickettsiales bacterium]
MSHPSLNTQPDVSRETTSRLEQYVALLLKWNGTINLIGRATVDDIWDRHIADSLQLMGLITPDTARIADLGSGAGLPGLVIACCLPDAPITLVERDQRKAAFLLQAAQELGLKRVRVIAKSLETIDETFDIITARALTSLDLLCGFAWPLMGVNTICLFPKGADFAREIEEAQRNWQFSYQLHPSITNEKSCIISLTKLSLKEPKGIR